MADVKEEQEPSIEDILESIRQIISDEEEDGADGGDLEAEEAIDDKATDVDISQAVDDDKPADVDIPQAVDDDKPADVDGDVTEEMPDEEVLELDDIVEDADGGDLKSMDDDDESVGDVDGQVEEDDYKPADIDGDVADDSDIAADIVMEEAVEDYGGIMSDDTEDAAVDSLSKLAANVFVEAESHAEMVMPPGRITLEQMTRELMRPMLKEWLDMRLPDLVESLVQREIRKLSDRAEK